MMGTVNERGRAQRNTTWFRLVDRIATGSFGRGSWWDATQSISAMAVSRNGEKPPSAAFDALARCLDSGKSGFMRRRKHYY
jgi:hypothetical protein